MRWLAVALALLAAEVQAANDLLILRDGTQRRGDLQWCNSQQCQLDKAQIPQDAVAWIGLDGAKAPAPKPRNPAQNELHLRSGSVEPALVVALDAQSVYTDRGAKPRKGVAWIHLVPMPLASGGAAQPGSASKEAFPRAYVWEGRIEVENVYEGRNGRHRWQAEYALRLLEHPRDYSRFYRDNVRGFLLEPQHLSYRIVADQHYDRGAYAKGTVVMKGEASGTFTTAQLAGGRVVVGDVHELTAPGRSGASTALTFASSREFLEYVNDRAAPGAYNVHVGFINYKNDGPWSRVRNLYRGIDRSGTHPLFFRDDPDQDFIHWVPASMPDGTNVIGRLASPDQAEVSGSVSYPIGGGVSAGDHEPQRVSVRWSFRRTPR